MTTAPGHDSGHGFSWADYVDWLATEHGTLTAVAEKLAAMRAFADDVGSVERALRRLRARGHKSGGTWGARAVATFGLPNAASERTRWMGAYHSRFVDLAVPVCQDLLRAWDRPPIVDAPGARTWLDVAHATIALRQNDFAAAKVHHLRARASLGRAPADARAELVLAEAFVASRDAIDRVAPLLAEVEPLLAEPMAESDRSCLHARWIDQRAYEANKRTRDLAAAEALYRSLPDRDAPPFALCRRANGLAYARWKQGSREEAVAFARAGVRHAGDGGHLRLRAMALSLLGRVLGGEEGEQVLERARAIVAALDDEGLRLRFSPRAS